ncbi:PIN domain nuclease [Streptomyces sp. Li-HN-5-11]|uniref:PIN domain nuclease n=1 Tax=Streptomyces sp. Li-HN-5-11 TaxID=3075432 RepID=UPI0028AC383B|nr:PIN domain nuclease [Streptomyces sp. Li-HN-5-11]WNM30581.1 PIN domain nuclease [Streptomyces sp. Li-HN-5-11]
MTTATYLIDTSALVRILRQPALSHWEQPLQEGIIARCPVTEIEFLYSARNSEEREQLVLDMDELFGWAPLDDRALTRAWSVQRELTEKGLHRSAGAVDLLVAATAELRGLTVLHHDKDFETIASVTGQPTQWLAPPGSL